MTVLLKLGAAATALSLAVTSMAEDPALPDGFVEVNPEEAALVCGGACNISSGTATVCCEVTHTYSNISGIPGDKGDETYSYECDANYPGCGGTAVKGCDTGVE